MWRVLYVYLLVGRSFHFVLPFSSANGIFLHIELGTGFAMDACGNTIRKMVFSQTWIIFTSCLSKLLLLFWFFWFLCERASECVNVCAWEWEGLVSSDLHYPHRNTHLVPINYFARNIDRNFRKLKKCGNSQWCLWF